MDIWDPKDPGEIKDYSRSLAAQMKADGDAISTSVWTVEPASLTIDSPPSSITGDIVNVWVSGGVAGTVYKLRNEVVTTGGVAARPRTYIRTFSLRVRDL